LILLGFVLVVGYFYIVGHDIFVYINAQSSSEWNTKLELPWITVMNNIKYINESKSFILYEMNILTIGFNFIFLIFFTLLTILGKKYLRNTYLIFIIMNILIVLFMANTLENSIRFSIPIFPFFMLLGIFGNKNKNLNYFLLPFFLILLGLFTILFVNCCWIS
jgi:hypothetical protein